MKKALLVFTIAAISLLGQGQISTQDNGVVGPKTSADGTPSQVRLGRDSAVVTQDAHARYQEAVARGNVYTLASIGITIATANNSPLTANTGQPLVGIFNPPNSGKNAVILQGVIGYVSGTTPANAMCAWNVIPNPTGITAASANTPVNNLTFSSSGSQMRGYVNSAITGSVTATLLRPIGGVTAAFASSATAGLNGMVVEETAGAIVAPPGTFIGIACGSAAGTTWIVPASMTWEEVTP